VVILALLDIPVKKDPPDQRVILDWLARLEQLDLLELKVKKETKVSHTM
jgi:hypothetical protein